MAEKLTHWRRVLTTDSLGGFDLDDGKGGFIEIDVTIDRTRPTEVKDQNGDKTTELVLYFKETGIKPMILNVTNSKTLQKLLKTPYYEQWSGRLIRIGTEKVKAFGELHDALRIRPYLPPKKTQKQAVPCAVCGKAITDYQGAPAQTIIDRSTAELGQPTCVPCWNAKKKEETNADDQDQN